MCRSLGVGGLQPLSDDRVYWGEQLNLRAQMLPGQYKSIALQLDVPVAILTCLLWAGDRLSGNRPWRVPGFSLQSQAAISPCSSDGAEQQKFP